MKKQPWKSGLLIALFLAISYGLMAQTGTHIEGKVTDIDGEPLAGVNILVKGLVVGTVSDIDGNYAFDVRSQPPLTLIISMVGYESQEISITDANTTGLDLMMTEQFIMGQEVVVSASRMEQSIMESPVSIEKMGILAVKNTASDSYYKGIANLKGVDMTTSSINFQIFNARGFNSTGNTRFVQLIDGMDTQAPALNFPIGSLNGPSDLDVESIEFIPGAASALYGPNAFNGILLINSKNPFDYQGLSATAKLSMNHLGDSDLNNQDDPVANPDNEAFGPGGLQPMYEASIRYAKAFNNKVAVKFNFTYSGATDWYGTSLQNRNAASTPAGLSYNPGADRLHAFGDEVAINMGIVKSSSAFRSNAEALGLDWTLLPSITVSRTPYLERDIVDYGAKNIKVGGGVFYRLTDRVELSYNYSYGGGTSVYTGAQRYSLANFNIQSHKLELRGDNFFVRGYTTQENSGGSFIADLTGVLINDSWRDNELWFALYGLGYLTGISNGQSEESAHRTARTWADGPVVNTENGDVIPGRIVPGTPEFEEALANAKSDVIPNGSKFADKSALYHAEGQYNFKNEISFMDLLVGASYQLYDLKSNGTIFPDSEENPITITEYGGFVQGSKALANERLRLTASVRFDKNENFKGQVNPRVSAVIKAAENHNIRLSFQTGFRNPTTQGQHIDLNVVSARLLGGLKYYRDKYDIFENAYTQASVNEFVEAYAQTADGTQLGNPDLLSILVPYSEEDVPEVKPEQISSFEVGYKALVNNNLLIDIAGYYNIYNDFITQVSMRKAAGIIDIEGVSTDPGSPDYWGINSKTEQNIRNAQALLTPITTPGKENTFQTYTNFDQQVIGAGAALGADYMLGRGYTVSLNYSWNKLIEGLGDNFLNDFNTPEHKANVSFSNRKVTDKLGFNVAYRWQNAFHWEASFGRGEVPAVGTLDAQLSYKLSGMRSILKVGGSNLLNTRYVLNYGGPTLGAIYYVSLTFDELLN
ncbi:MAG: carboxypeptidase-like regulatory domain-containing protein [Cyclobacteriaceae bacterium]|nr:carboxypeptidase-like regulatory domain-containing protein [Cyclobacteriaceae bacterium]